MTEPNLNNAEATEIPISRLQPLESSVLPNALEENISLAPDSAKKITLPDGFDPIGNDDDELDILEDFDDEEVDLDDEGSEGSGDRQQAEEEGAGDLEERSACSNFSYRTGGIPEAHRWSFILPQSKRSLDLKRWKRS